MKRIIILLLMVPLYLSIQAQSIDKAFDYFENEDYENALIEFEKLMPYFIETVKDKNDSLDLGFILFIIGLSHDNTNDFEKAEKYYLEAKAIYRAIESTSDSVYELIISNLVIVYLIKEQYDKAIYYNIELLENIERILENESPEYCIYLHDLAFLFKKTSQYEKALPLFIEALECVEITCGKDHTEYRDVINNLSLLYEDIKQYDKAISYKIELLENIERALGNEASEYCISLHDLALLYYETSQYKKALPLFVYALECIEKTLGKEHLSYGTTLNNLAVLYNYLGENDKALSLYIEALENTEITLGKKHSSYATSLNNLALLYHNMGQYDKAMPLYIEALENRKKTLGEDHPLFGASLNNLASLYKTIGQYEKALPLYIKTLEIIEKSLGKEHLNYGSSLNNLASLYKDLGQYEKAMPLYIEALENTKKNLGKDHSVYGLRLNNLAGLYKTIGQYDKSHALYIEALENKEKTMGKEHPSYGTSLNNLASLYTTIGQYEKAMPLYIEALENTKKNLGKDHSDYGLRLNNLAGLYKTIGQYDKAQTLYIEALENKGKTLGKEHPSYGTILNNLGHLYNSLEQSDKALQLYIEALENTEKAFGKEHPGYGLQLNNLAYLYHQSLGQNDKALPLYLKALENTEKTLGKDHNNYRIRLNNLANLYHNMGQYEKAVPLYKEVKSISLKNIEKNFSFLSENEKGEYLKTVLFNFKIYQSFYLNYHTENDTVAAESFAIELALKNMLLNASIDMRRVILSSGDESMLQLFDDWLTLKAMLANQYNKPVSERHLDIQETENRAEQMEQELVRFSSTFAQRTKIGVLSHVDVQNELNNNEVVIEFSSFRYYNGKEWTDSTLYMALVLRKEDEHPHLVPLFEQKQLDTLLQRNEPSPRVYINNLYRNKELYKLLWQPLTHLIPEGSTVYFAPSGSLHQIALAALAVDDTTCLSDIYNLVQLSTTAMLTQETAFADTHISTVALFGGINYEANENDLLAFAEGINEDKVFITRGLPYDIDRGQRKWDFLPGSLKEVENIAGLSRKNKTETRLYTGNQALEEQLKSLGGVSSPRIIHIATHGFFFPDPEKQYKDMGLISLEDNNIFKMSDNPLNRSGLLFAGSNNTWLGKASYTHIEDGILTAYEASNLNLSQTQLVVLSACETGLGDIKGSEGVFGLQRAFKAASVEYIIMSLWKVPDTETAEFMTAFYENLFGGLSIPEAFSKTQTLMKNKYKHEPFKWAGFVLMK